MGTSKPDTHGNGNGADGSQPREVGPADESESREASLTALVSTVVAITSTLNRIDPTSLEPDERGAVDELIKALRQQIGAGLEDSA
jgi:hypothetical protein